MGWAGVLPQRPGLRAAAIRCYQRFRPTGKASQLRFRQEYGGLRIGDLDPLWNWPALCTFVGISCGLQMKAVPVVSVCA